MTISTPIWMTDLHRGAIVLFAERGDYSGKQRPGLVVQHAATLPDAPSVTLCGITTFPVPAPTRIVVVPDETNGLREISYVMVDKIASVRRERIREAIGTLDEASLGQVDQALRRWLDL